MRPKGKSTLWPGRAIRSRYTRRLRPCLQNAAQTTCRSWRGDQTGDAPNVMLQRWCFNCRICEVLTMLQVSSFPCRGRACDSTVSQKLVLVRPHARPCRQIVNCMFKSDRLGRIAALKAAFRLAKSFKSPSTTSMPYASSILAASLERLRVIARSL